MSKFWRSILSSKDAASSRRLITLIISFHFILASFAVLFVAFYVIFYIPKGQVDKDLLNLLKEVLQYDFYIIVSGLGFITADVAGHVLIEAAKAKFSSIGAYDSTTTTTTLPDECDKNQHVQL